MYTYQICFCEISGFHILWPVSTLNVIDSYMLVRTS